MTENGPRPARRGGRLAISAVLVLALAGYGTLDAYDVLPGVLTTAPAPPEAEPFPDVVLPGALAAPSVTPPDEEAPLPDVAALEALLEDFEEDDRRTGDYGAVIEDALTGEPLLERAGGVARTPASSLKVLTAAAALATLGPETRLRTSAVLDGQTLVLVGGGDVLLAAGEGDPEHAVGHAGLADLAAETATALAGRGMDEVRLGLDDTLFSGPGYHEDLADSDRRYVMAIQPLAVESGRTDDGHSSDPALAAARDFAEALREEGIEVSALARQAAPEGAEELAAVESAPVSAVVRQMLRASDNSVAEVLARLVAIDRGGTADFAGGARAVGEALEELGLDLSDVVIDDGSGLSTESRVPPEVLVDVLARAEEEPELRALLPGMPVSGLHGTLAHRYQQAGAGSVRAKTGTLIRTISLTGLVVTEDGRPLRFSVMTDGLEPGTAGQARLAVDDLLAGIAACGC